MVILDESESIVAVGICQPIRIQYDDVIGWLTNTLSKSVLMCLFGTVFNSLKQW